MGGKREEVGAVMKIGYRVAIVRYYFPFFAVDYAIDNNEINTLYIYTHIHIHTYTHIHIYIYSTYTVHIQ